MWTVCVVSVPVPSNVCSLCLSAAGSHRPDTRHGAESDLEPAQGSTALTSYCLQSPQLHKSNDNLSHPKLMGAHCNNLDKTLSDVRPDNTWYKTKKFFIYKIRGELRFSILAPKVWQEFSIRCSKKQFNVHVKTIVFHRHDNPIIYYLNSLSNAWPVCLPVYYLPTVHSYLFPPLLTDWSCKRYNNKDLMDTKRKCLSIIMPQGVHQVQHFPSFWGHISGINTSNIDTEWRQYSIG